MYWVKVGPCIIDNIELKKSNFNNVIVGSLQTLLAVFKIYH